MVWSEYEAYVLQVKQIGVSACGATAVINVLVSSSHIYIANICKLLPSIDLQFFPMICFPEM